MVVNELGDTNIKPNSELIYKMKKKKRKLSAFKGHKHTREAKEKNRIAHLGNKSFLGKQHSLETRLLFSKQRKGRKLTNSWKKKIRESCQGINKGKKNGMYGKTPKYKRIKYGNIWMRSSYEIKFAYFLDCNKIKWQYEPKTFDLGNATYTPDFYIPEWDLYVEIKGYWHKGSKKRFDLFRKLYANINIKILTFETLKNLGIL